MNSESDYLSRSDAVIRSTPDSCETFALDKIPTGDFCRCSGARAWTPADTCNVKLDRRWKIVISARDVALAAGIVHGNSTTCVATAQNQFEEIRSRGPRTIGGALSEAHERTRIGMTVLGVSPFGVYGLS